MEYPLPQFLSIKPKVAGPFNLAQLLWIVGGALVSIIFYFTAPLMTFVLIGIPIMIVAFILAFGKRKGFPIPTIIVRSFSFIFASKRYLWKKIDTPAIMLPKATKAKPVEPKDDKAISLKISGQSRLKEIGRLIEIHSK
ncbi:PrgI family protein [Patescibacteria group bacterium]|nr:PrgI family protein [Patescibacteria group bacterium]MBU4162058.1 PrgI family protein [Patescibacteria group bacterium]